MKLLFLLDSTLLGIGEDEAVDDMEQPAEINRC